MHFRTVTAKSILNKTAIPGFTYCLNPYMGCQHGCRYCYATFITKRFNPRSESWGRFVDVKINAPTLLERALKRAKRGVVYLSSITDPYQPAEKKYGLTRKSLKLLLARQFPVNIQTKSSLVLRDLDLIKEFDDIEIGVSVTTHGEKMRKLFEPGAPPIASRISTLERLHSAGITTYAFIAPMLPLDPPKLVALLAKVADCILIDRLNYVGRTKHLYKKHGLERYLSEAYFEETARTIKALGHMRNIRVEAVF